MLKQFKIVFYIIVVLVGIAVLQLMSEFLYRFTKPEAPIYELFWSDEFDYNGAPDSDTWEYILGDGCPALCGWGNNELEYYTDKPENIRVENGQLVIQIQSDSAYRKKYTSGKIRSRSSKSILYGKVEISAKNPSGRGTWPALWMLPEKDSYGGWPNSGEIDIMEHVGFDPDTIIGTVHTKSYHHLIGTQKGKYTSVPDNESAFHEYEIQWAPEKIDFLIDNNLYFTFDNEQKSSKEWPFDKKFYLIMNLAVGGNWGGRQGVDESIVGQQFLIDYVRVYEDKSPKKLF
ncbi:glycoside hydrolase family 16 protein [Saprospiraceae bacterium]|nr:glycoside hydrolase family 16 protein [Saprospiraceae bacterium]